jgi:hypothetical protein
MQAATMTALTLRYRFDLERGLIAALEIAV